MYRVFFWFIVICNIAFAEPTTTKIEVNANTIVSKNGIVYATNGVEVFYQGSILKADTLVYDRKKKILTLNGHVEAIGYQGVKEQSTQVIIDINNSDIKFKKLFMVSDNDIWMTSEKAEKKDNIYTTGTSILSSCDISNPLWKMAFDKSKYDKNDEYIKLYDTTVYFMNTPVFYTPYLAFSTNNKRSSGFLFPLFGFNEDEGLIYEQPFFWAIAPNMDLEFNPQIRTRRSYGGYATFRFVDTNTSKGSLRVGYFKDKSSYNSTYLIDDKEHYGIEFRYDNSNVLSKYIGENYQDGLYVNTIYLNDIDYLNLQKSRFTDFGLSPFQESKINYYLQNNDYYMGVNAKYFIDTRNNIDKDETLQILPSLQLHKYLSKIIFDDLTYSIDMHISNYFRKEGINLKQIEFSIPLEYTMSFFDDYISLSFAEDIYYSKFFFSNGEFAYDRYRYFSNLNKIKLFSDLTKKYTSFTHVLQPSITYLSPGFEDEEPVFYNDFTEDQQDLFNVGMPQEHYKVSLGNYFYDSNANLIFFQRLSQIYYTHKTIYRRYKLADLHNEIQYNIGAWQIYNELVYSHEYSKIRESTTHISYTTDMLNLAFNHTYRDILGDEDSDSLKEANEFNINIDYHYDRYWDFKGAVTYNFDSSSSKQWMIGTRYHQDCWGVSLEIKREIIPRPNGSETQNGFYLLMNFTPFTSLGAKL